jgi:uncharacterized protein YjbI with pentapeptide repeats
LAQLLLAEPLWEVKEERMNAERKRHWWRNRNLLWAITVIFAVWILILVSIIVDDIRGKQEVGFWEWVGVLIIPVVLSAGAALLTNAQTQREVTATHLQAQDEALQQYLDQVSNLLVAPEKGEKPTGSHLVSKLMQARTLALLLKLDRDRKRQPLKLIAQLDLINRASPLLSLKNAGLDDADLHEVTLLNVSLREADLRLTDLTGSHLGGSDLAWADLRGADLRRAVLTDASLERANLLPYDRRNPAQLNAPHLRNGSDPSHIDRKSRLTPGKLNDRHLTLTRLDEANLQRADLSRAYLYRVDLTGADLSGANLRGADLRRADLSGADLRGADLTDANLEDARLSRVKLGSYTRQDGHAKQSVEMTTILHRAYLSRADLTGAVECNGEGQERQVTTRWLEEKTALLSGATMPDGRRYPR